MARRKPTKTIGLPKATATTAKQSRNDKGELKDSETLFRLVADSAPGMIWMSGIDPRCTYVNKTWLDFTGRSLQQEIGAGWAEGIHPDDLQNCLDTFTQSYDRQRQFRIEYRLRRYDGEYRWILDIGVPRFDQDRSFAGYIGIAVDLTAHKQTEQAFVESERRLRLAAQAARMFAYSWDAVTDIIERSGESAEILGIGPGEAATGAAVSAMVHPDDKQTVEDALAKLTLDKPNLRITYRIIRPDGRVTWLERNSHAYFNEHGKLERIIGMIVDVTERKEADQERLDLAGRLINAQEQERSRLARELHDDFGQRLAMIAVGLEEADKKIQEPAVREELHKLRSQVNALATDIHSVSHRLHSSTLETLGLTAGVRSFCAEFASKNGIEIEFGHHGIPRSTSPQTALCIFRIVQEGLRNVKKHSRATRVDVRLHGNSEAISLDLSDNGIGFRLSDSIASHGIGLCSMKERARILGGTFEVQSRPGQGTRITVTLPLGSGTDC